MIHFEIDQEGVQAVADALGATPKEVRGAFTRALQRTAVTLRTMAGRGLRSELELRTIGTLRKRLKTLRLGRFDGQTIQLWFGLNDMPVSWFKGTPKQDATGATFRGQDYAGAFVARSAVKGRKTVLKRTGKGRLHIQEQLVPVKDKALTFVEDEIFDKTEAIFWQHFRRDLRARVNYKLGEA